MPSPFPGMDPFLENPEIFPDFHDRFIAYLSETLQPDLPPAYYAALGRRAWVEVSERFIGPDVDLVREANRASGGESGVVVAEQPIAGPVVVHVPHDRHVETLVEIYVGRTHERRLVTAIELLSPSNKVAGEQGRDLYQRKQQELLNSKVHLVEIDLLRDGLHTTAVPERRVKRMVGPFDYHVCVHRFDNLEDYFVYPIRLPHALPAIQIPLLPGDGAVTLNLQRVFERTYSAGPYAREIDYRSDPLLPPLTPEYADWCRQVLEQGGKFHR